MGGGHPSSIEKKWLMAHGISQLMALACEKLSNCNKHRLTNVRAFLAALWPALLSSQSNSINQRRNISRCLRLLECCKYIERGIAKMSSSLSRIIWHYVRVEAIQSKSNQYAVDDQPRSDGGATPWLCLNEIWCTPVLRSSGEGSSIHIIPCLSLTKRNNRHHLSYQLSSL